MFFLRSRQEFLGTDNTKDVCHGRPQKNSTSFEDEFNHDMSCATNITSGPNPARSTIPSGIEYPSWNNSHRKLLPLHRDGQLPQQTMAVPHFVSRRHQSRRVSPDWEGRCCCVVFLVTRIRRTGNQLAKSLTEFADHILPDA